MNRKKLQAIVPYILTALLVIAGIIMLIPCIGKQIQYTGKLATAFRAAADAKSMAEDTEAGELAQLQNENQSLEQSIADLEKENADLDAQTAALQQKYDSLAQIEDNQYYLAIMESLTEGMEKVEQYINEAQ